jgi:uncharacterized protein with FMN-binding domain
MKNRYLGAVGFVLGAGAVLLASPPSFLTAPEEILEPITPVAPVAPITPVAPVAPVAPVVIPTPNVTPTPTVTAKPAVTAKPVVTQTPTSPVTSQTISGGVFAAGKYGNVQVQIVVKNGVITSAKALVFPDGDSRSSSISAAAIPVLIEQTLAAQSSEGIDGASGASYTSAAWINSLQSALIKV